MLDHSLKEQVKSIFAQLEAEYLLDIAVHPDHASKTALVELLTDVADTTDRISCRISDGQSLEFALLKNGVSTGISFRGIPNGHEFTSLLMAILNSDGKGKNIPDQATIARIQALKGDIDLHTYVSLTCTNCPEVVQSLNLMAILNSRIRHEMVDGALFQDEVSGLNVQAVPSVFADGHLLSVGRTELGELLEKLEARYGSEPTAQVDSTPRPYDVIVVGGGPAGVSAAIYAARKGQHVAVIADRIGGQVKETVGIENLISVPYTTGEQLAASLRQHAQQYNIDLLEHRKVDQVTIDGPNKVVRTGSGEQFISPYLIIATGASWRKLNVPGESEYIGKGVAFCAHCDGPFYKGKHVAVVGGGNSGIEAAIDLAGICSQVTVLEFLDNLKADTVLQEKAKAIANINIMTSMETKEVVGNGTKVVALRVKNRQSGEERSIDLDGVFVQIGLVPNSAAFKDLVTVNRMGEIEVDAHCRTSVSGIYAAGDVTTVPFKQIIISMGEGAKAALSAFEDKVRAI